ncbi:MAG: c-type cytochrome [Chloroflexi bacterium]|nr:c-type cytochrome [Chloroflexota bacterium]
MYGSIQARPSSDRVLKRARRGKSEALDVEKKLAAVALLTIIVVAFIPLYWMGEPARQASAAARFKTESMARGAALFSQSCAFCHGATGQGLVGPALRATKMDDKALVKTVERGRPGTAMLPWGDDDGGPLKANDIQDLATFILNWDDSLLEARSVASSTQAAAPAVVATSGPAASAAPRPTSVAIAATTTPTPSSLPASPQSGDTPSTAGKQLFSSLGCAACHGANGEGTALAPALAGLAGKQVPLASGQTVVADDAYLTESITAPDAAIVKGYQGGMMPRVNLTDIQTGQLVAFMKSLK